MDAPVRSRRTLPDDGARRIGSAARGAKFFGRGGEVVDQKKDAVGELLARADRRAWASLARFDKPFLTAFGDSDRHHGGRRAGAAEEDRRRGRPHITLGRGGHFLQEDDGEELGRVVVDFVKG